MLRLKGTGRAEMLLSDPLRSLCKKAVKENEPTPHLPFCLPLHIGTASLWATVAAHFIVFGIFLLAVNRSYHTRLPRLLLEFDEAEDAGYDHHKTDYNADDQHGGQV